MMVVGNIMANAEFDYGKFMNRFEVYNYSKGKSMYTEKNIQEVYDLTMDDFEALSLSIALVVNEFIDKKQKDKPGLCTSCMRNKATKPHPCPFQKEINNMPDTLCTCCSDCQHECFMDI